MKAYVNYYGPPPAVSSSETAEEREMRIMGPSIVQVHPEPYWKLPAKEVADVELLKVQRNDFRFGSHFCKYAVEELPGGEFAIVCLEHPDVPAP